MKAEDVKALIDELHQSGEPLGHDAADALEALAAENARLREALTPSGSTKYAYSGEFKETVFYGHDEDGNECWGDHVIEWTTIKDIMKAITARAAPTATPTPQEPSE